jgi:hypothetical protein
LIQLILHPALHDGVVDLERINRSFMVVIPKKPSVVAVDAFWAICLQICSVKIIAKTLTVCLQQQINRLIDTPLNPAFSKVNRSL